MDILQTLTATLGDRYDMQREIGRGGMATVYLAVDRSNGTEVAIKVLNPELSASITGSRFMREIEVMTRLEHPHILACTDSGTTEGLHYYVMPYVRGESLRHRINREGQLGVDEAVRIITEAAAALDYAHAQGVVHRDIKPDNLLLDNGTVLVADFGVARIVQETDGEKLTQTGTSIGTPVYMSPEQCYGRTVTASSDVYALGCVLYEMLVGEPPFTGVTATTIMSRHAMEAPPGISVVRPSVPESVEVAYFAAMQKVPADRPKTATAFAEMMKDAKATLGAVARPTSRASTAGAVTLPIAAAVPWYMQPVAQVLLLLVLVGGGFGLWKIVGSGGAVAPGPDARRLAVLYFDNVTDDRSLDYLADGLTESVIASLGSVPSLYVVSRGGSELFRNSEASSDSIARALDVGVLVRGSMAKEGSNIQVSVRLVDGASGADIGRASVAYPVANPLVLRDSVSARVAELIREQLGTEIRMREQRDATRNQEAWTLVRRAEAARKRGDKVLASGDREGGFREFGTVDSLLVAASGLDAKWPDPLAMRAALAYRRARVTIADPMMAGAWIDSGLVHAEAALQRSATSPDALEARGNLHYLKAIGGLEPDNKKVDQLIESARADFEKSTTLNPAQAGAWATLSHLYYRVGSTLDVNTAARKAYEADAFLSNADVVLQRLFLSSYDLGEFRPKAESYCTQINKRFGASMYAARCQLLLMTTKVVAPEPARAWLLADSAVARSPQPQRAYQRLAGDILVGAVLARAGLNDSARAVLQRTRAEPQLDPSQDLVLYGAFAYTILGDTVEALDNLKRYFASNEARRAPYREDPGWWFRPLAGHPEFRRIVGSAP